MCGMRREEATQSWHESALAKLPVNVDLHAIGRACGRGRVTASSLTPVPWNYDGPIAITGKECEQETCWPTCHFPPRNPDLRGNWIMIASGPGDFRKPVRTPVSLIDAA